MTIYRYYVENEDPEDGLATLCATCAQARRANGEACEHAATPESWEELMCEDCHVMNAQGDLWSREMKGTYHETA